MKGRHLRRGSQVVFEKLDVPLEEPVDLSRRSNTVVKTQSFGVLPAGRAYPYLCTTAVSIGAAFRQACQFFFGLTLLPPSAVSPDHKEVGRVENSETFSVRRIIMQLNGRNLVLILQHSIVVLQFKYCRQFEAMAFKLDRDSHFPAGIAPGHIRATATNATRRIGVPNVCNDGLRLFGKIKPRGPCRVIRFAQ